MKLLVAIVQDADGGRLRQELNDQGFRSTKLASTGGFLREGNTTFLIGVQDEEVTRVKNIIERTCRQRTKLMPHSFFEGGESLYNEALEVTVGGAVLFVLPLEEFFRI